MKEIEKNTDISMPQIPEESPRIRGYEWDYKNWRIAQGEREKARARKRAAVFFAVCAAVTLVLLSALAIANAF